MTLRSTLAFPLISLCALAACQAQQVDSTSIGQGPVPPAPPALPPPPSTEGAGGAVTDPGGLVPPDQVVNAPLPTGSPQEEADSGLPQVQTMVNQNCANTQVTAVDTTVLVPADIIIAVDTSGSMDVEAQFVQEQLNDFSQQIISSGVDAHVVLIARAGVAPQAGDAGTPVGGGAGGGGAGGAVGGGGGLGPGNNISICIDAPLGSGECPADTKLPAYLHVDGYVDSHNALDLLVSSFDDWKAQLRPNSVKALLVVTDDDVLAGAGGGGLNATPPAPADVDAKVAKFLVDFPALDPVLLERWNFNSVYAYAKDDTCMDDQGQQLAANVGTGYASLVTTTGGVSGDLCQQDFKPVFDKLATQIVENAGAEIVCEWEIPPAVDGQTFSTDLVQVNRTLGGDAGMTSSLTRVSTLDECAAGGWYFDDNYSPSRIIACESTCADMQDDSGGGIGVVFGCEVVEGCAASDEATLEAGGDVGSETTTLVVDGGSAGPVACEWVLPTLDDRQQQLDLENVNVRYTTDKGFGVLMGSVATPTECASVDLGWYFDNPDKPTKIVACPETCEVLTSRQVTEVNALFGCKTKPAKQRTL